MLQRSRLHALADNECAVLFHHQPVVPPDGECLQQVQDLEVMIRIRHRTPILLERQKGDAAVVILERFALQFPAGCRMQLKPFVPSMHMPVPLGRVPEVIQ